MTDKGQSQIFGDRFQFLTKINKFAHFIFKSRAMLKPISTMASRLVHISKTSHRDSNEAIPPDGFQRMDIECDKQGNSNVKKF